MRPLIIGIGGAHSGAGKTTYASLLLKKLRGWGAIKYTKTALYSSIIDDREILCQEDKDTAVLLNSGAEAVLWVQSPPGELGEVLPQAVGKLAGFEGIIVEGNSAIEFLKPDIIIFIFGSNPERIKESAEKILKISDIVVREPKDTGSWNLKKNVRIFGRTHGGNTELEDCVKNMVERKEQVRVLLKGKAVGNKVPCSVARMLAKELNVSYKEVGAAADALDIKIADCELGCF